MRCCFTVAHFLGIQNYAKKLHKILAGNSPNGQIIF
jgi:hypothetical protein